MSKSQQPKKTKIKTTADSKEGLVSIIAFDGAKVSKKVQQKPQLSTKQSLVKLKKVISEGVFALPDNDNIYGRKRTTRIK